MIEDPADDQRVGDNGDWIRGYETRIDDMSRSAHQQLFDDWPGPKRQLARAADLLGHSLHPQLRADTHLLGETEAGTLLLHRNAALTWIILVPDVGPTDLRELLDLDEQRRSRVFAVSRRVAAVLRARGAYKVNLASLGNLVPQLHIHLVGRHPGDACWPLPVWGHLRHEVPWDPEEVAALRAALIHG